MRRNIAELTAEQAAYAERLFEHEIYPVVTPMALAPDTVFPLLAGLTVNLFVRLAPETKDSGERHAVVALPRALPRFFTLPAERGYHYLLLEDIVMLFLPRLFPGERILECAPIRLTRNADLTVREDQAGDLLEDMKEILTERRQSACIRLEVDNKASRAALDYLQVALEIQSRDVYSTPGPLGLTAFFRIANTPGFAELQEEEWPPQSTPRLRADESIFEAIARQDILLFHPYESFEPVVRFLVWKPYYDNKVFTWGLRLAKAIPIWESPRSVAQAIERARGELERGQILCIFAEGSISRTGDLLPFKRGLESIVRGLDAPIVPVHLGGLWESVYSFQGGRFFWKRPRRLRHPVVISFGDPMSPSSAASDVRQAVEHLGNRNALAQRTRRK